MRGAVSPATSTNPDWAGDLAREAVGDFVDDLAKFNAGAKVLTTARRMLLGRYATLSFPRRDGPTAPVGHWCGEEGTIPVARFSLQSAKLGRMKRLVCTSQVQTHAEDVESESAKANPCWTRWSMKVCSCR